MEAHILLHRGTNLFLNLISTFNTITRKLHEMEQLINFFLNLFFNWEISYRQPPTVDVDEEQQPVGLGSILGEQAWPGGVIAVHGNRLEANRDGGNNVLGNISVNRGVVGLMAAVERGPGNGVALQAAVPEFPPFAVRQRTGVMRRRRLLCRRSFPQSPPLVIH